MRDASDDRQTASWRRRDDDVVVYVDQSEIAATFDDRARTYARGSWHRRYGERLVELAGLRPGWRVVDAGTGTGFAALAARRAVGRTGRVVGVDISSDMVTRARAAIGGSEPASVLLARADATHLPLPSRSVDAVICSAALLYMPVDAALAEWRRILRPGGLVGFSTMQRDNPPSAVLFRRLAASYGLRVSDPSARLGSSEECCRALCAHEFDVRSIVPETVRFQAADLEQAWPVHARMYAAELDTLSQVDRARMETAYVRALKVPTTDAGGSLDEAAVLYAFATSRS
jgi:ubiquinone/menaquinone biosynthesis C-methylase UbiE